jgi:hypothetical protein
VVWQALAESAIDRVRRPELEIYVQRSLAKRRIGIMFSCLYLLYQISMLWFLFSKTRRSRV